VTDYKNKKVLVFGLGILGGGVATTNWLLKHGALVTITDLKTATELQSALEQITGPVELRLGGHDDTLIRECDAIICNQDVSINNPYIQLAFKLGKAVETEGTLFYKLFPKRIVGITGTRGKTTTTAWTNAFLQTQSRSTTAGNWGDINPFLEIVDRGDDFDIAVTEVPSFQLEYFHLIDRGPEVAVITNLSPDHLNRHGDMRGYAQAKANLFLKQTSDQHLILNHDNDWTEFFLAEHPRAKVWQFSKTKLPQNIDGLYVESGKLVFQERSTAAPVISIDNFSAEKGEHNLENLLASALAAHCAGVSWEHIQATIPVLPTVKFRQEVIFESEQLTIINDTAATSPEGAIVAMKRFAGPHTVFIFGGTDRQLDFASWAQEAQKIPSDNIFFLAGSATDKMLAALAHPTDTPIFDTLTDCVHAALKKAGQYPESTVVFSPGAKSFEKFKNEYDRGEQFANIVHSALHD
jgi:UDP-N-acetylmuramoylalanine--D-glutamate ligase